MQGIQREFSVKGMVELVGKTSQLLAALMAGGLQRHRDKQKGYQATMDDANTNSNAEWCCGMVNVLAVELSGGVASTIWGEGSLKQQLEVCFGQYLGQRFLASNQTKQPQIRRILFPMPNLLRSSKV
jgi:hypothetical protein